MRSQGRQPLVARGNETWFEPRRGGRTPVGGNLSPLRGSNHVSLRSVPGVARAFGPLHPWLRIRRRSAALTVGLAPLDPPYETRSRPLEIPLRERQERRPVRPGRVPAGVLAERHLAVGQRRLLRRELRRPQPLLAE